MVRILEKKLFSEYMNNDESFIFGINGLLRLSVAKEILYVYAPMGFLNSYIDPMQNYSIECTLAITDKRILFINTNNINSYTKGASYSFNIDEIKLKYKKLFGKKQFIINTNNHELFDFTEQVLVFECYDKQDENIDKLNVLLSEHAL